MIIITIISCYSLAITYQFPSSIPLFTQVIQVLGPPITPSDVSYLADHGSHLRVMSAKQQQNEPAADDEQAKFREILRNIHPLAKAIPKVYGEIHDLIEREQPHCQGIWSRTSLALRFYEWNAIARPTDHPRLVVFLACVAARNGMARNKNDKFTSVVQAKGLNLWADRELRTMLAKDEHAHEEEASTRASSASTAAAVNDKQVTIKREAPADFDKTSLPEIKRVKHKLLMSAGTQTQAKYVDSETQTVALPIRETPAAQVPDLFLRSANTPSASTATTIEVNARIGGADTSSLESHIETIVRTVLAQSMDAMHARIKDVCVTTMRPILEEASTQPAQPSQSAQLQQDRGLSNNRFHAGGYCASSFGLEMPAMLMRRRMLHPTTMVEAQGFMGGGGGGSAGGSLIEYPAPGMGFGQDYEEPGIQNFGRYHPCRRGY